MARIYSSLGESGSNYDDIKELIPKKTSQLINDGENGLDKFITEIDLGGKTFQFSNMSVIPVTHGMGRYVDVSVILGTELVLADVFFETDLNTIVVKLKKPETGVILIK